MNHFSAQIQPATLMQEITHPELVSALRKKPEDYQPTAQQMEAAHFSSGYAFEAAEAGDHIKKWVWNNIPFDREKYIKELGDAEFYAEATRQVLGITREEVLAANIAKLSKRYPGLRYSDAAAQARLDEVNKAFE